ncbi:MAG: helix-turn-helix domain-containing protein [Bacteroidia bacterium]|jgi:excisionase family DNA binding protein|nr:helix-turn-helix domain-containing protein [Bacteroidia bacterium]
MQYILLQGIKLDDFLYEIEKTIEKKVNEKIETFRPKPAITYLERKAVAKMFGISLPTVDGWCREGKLNSYRIGKQIRFRSDEVEAVLVKRDFGRH